MPSNIVDFNAETPMEENTPLVCLSSRITLIAASKQKPACQYLCQALYASVECVTHRYALPELIVQDGNDSERECYLFRIVKVKKPRTSRQQCCFSLLYYGLPGILYLYFWLICQPIRSGDRMKYSSELLLRLYKSKWLKIDVF